MKVVFEVVVEDTSQDVSFKPSLQACWPKGKCEFWYDFRERDHNGLCLVLFRQGTERS